MNHSCKLQLGKKLFTDKELSKFFSVLDSTPSHICVWGMEVFLHVFLTSFLDVSEPLDSLTGKFHPGKIPRNPLDKEMAGPSTDPDGQHTRSTY